VTEAFFGTRIPTIGTDGDSAPFIIGRSHLRDVWSARDWPGVGGNGDDQTDGLTTFVHDATTAGKQMLLPAGTYGVSGNLVESALTSPFRLTGDGDLSVIEVGIDGDNMFDFVGRNLGSDTAVLNDGVKGSQTLEISTTGLAVGDYINLYDPANTLNGKSDYSQCFTAGETARIYRIDSSTECTLTDPLQFDYPAATAKFRKPETLSSVQASHLKIVRPDGLSASSPGSRIFHGHAIDYLELDDITFEHLDDDAISFSRVHGGRLTRLKMTKPDFDPVNGRPYMINLGEWSANIIASELVGDGFVHLLTTTANEDLGPAHDILVTNVVGRGGFSPGVNNHWNARRMTFSNVHVFGGNDDISDNSAAVNIRGRECTARNVTAHGLYRGVYISLGADDAVVENIVARDCNIGVDINASSRTKIRNVTTFGDTQEYGIQVADNVSFPAMTGTEIYNVQVHGDPSGAGLKFWSTSYDADTMVVKNFRARDASNEIEGANPRENSLTYECRVETTQTLTQNSTTLQDVTDMVFPLGAAETVFFELFLSLQAASNTTDFKLGWTYPASATATWGTSTTWTPVATGSGPNAQSTESTVATFGSGAGKNYVYYAGHFAGGGTAGDVQLQMAQNTGAAENNRILAGSVMRVTRIVGP
jgi:hypothetical protein